MWTQSEQQLFKAKPRANELSLDQGNKILITSLLWLVIFAEYAFTLTYKDFES